MEKICTVCSETFEQNQDPGITAMAYAVGRDTDNERCYSCALDHLAGGRWPEEGDFNSARLISGEMSDKQWRWLQEDMRAIESGRRSVWEPMDDEIDDSDWCYECNCDYYYCTCDLPDEDYDEE